MLSATRLLETPMRHHAFLPVLAALLMFAEPSVAFRATNGFTVTQTGPQDFVVNYRVTRNETSYWCAAGEFVTRDLGLPAKTRIYRASPPPRGAGEGIAFTLDSAAAAPEGGLSNFSAGGGDGSVSAGHARGSFCNFFEDIPFGDF
jgi:hypothetical protein